MDYSNLRTEKQEEYVGSILALKQKFLLAETQGRPKRPLFSALCDFFSFLDLMMFSRNKAFGEHKGPSRDFSTQCDLPEKIGFLHFLVFCNFL